MIKVDLSKKIPASRLPKRGPIIEKYTVILSRPNASATVYSLADQLLHLGKNLFYIQGGYDDYFFYEHPKTGERTEGYPLLYEDTYLIEQGQFIKTERGYIYDQTECIELYSRIKRLIELVPSNYTNRATLRDTKRIIYGLIGLLFFPSASVYEDLIPILKETEKNSAIISKVAQSIVHFLYQSEAYVRLNNKHYITHENREPGIVVNFATREMNDVLQALSVDAMRHYGNHASDKIVALLDCIEELKQALLQSNVPETVKRHVLWSSYNAIIHPTENSIKTLYMVANEVEGAPRPSQKIAIILRAIIDLLLGIVPGIVYLCDSKTKEAWKKAGRTGLSAITTNLAMQWEKVWLEGKIGSRSFIRCHEDAPNNNMHKPSAPL